MMKTGVYAITNLVNGKRYVGSAARNFRGRWNQHKCSLRKGRHHSIHLQKAWTKYGELAFEFSIILLCRPQQCVEFEQLLMEEFRTANRKHGYNIAPKAGSALGIKHSAESRANNSARQIGRKMTPEFCAKMKASMAKRMADPHGLSSLIEIATKMAHDPEIVARANEGKRRYWSTPRPKHIANMLASSNSPEANAKRSQTLKGRFFSAGHRSKIGEANKRRTISIETRSKMSSSGKIRHSTPEARSRMALIGSIGRINRRSFAA